MSNYEQLAGLIAKDIQCVLCDRWKRNVTVELNSAGVALIADLGHDIDMSSYVMGVYVPLMGDVEGDVFVFLPLRTAKIAADLMIGQTVGAVKVLGDMEASAVKEMGNVTIGAAVECVSTYLNVSMMLTVPNLAQGEVGALIDYVLPVHVRNGPEIYITRLKLRIDENDLDGMFLLIFGADVVERIRSLELTDANE